ncbi:hypothetical protein SynA1528_00163 [Synechococcus sp. A15-28]|nr:hypothetical protein SynA1528_00163 [Synechococcus sp. A15-28]
MNIYIFSKTGVYNRSEKIGFMHLRRDKYNVSYIIFIP